MVSPLRTWHHTEPKGLWPALGGLAVVTHVGVIGLSLPYVAGLVGNGGGSASAVVPIELIVDIDADANLVEATDLASGNNPPASEQSPQKAEPVESAPVVTRSQPTVAETPVSETPIENPPLVEEKTQPDNERPSNAEVATSNEEPSDIEENEAPVEQNESSGESQDAAPATGKDEETAPEEESPPDESGDLPVLGGDGQLPLPGGSSTSEDGDQVTALNFSRHDYVPDALRQDRFAINLPEPTDIPATTVRPKDVRCREISALPPMPLTYRVTISTVGTIQDATPWTGRTEVARSLNESEDAIRCLLKQSGWRFTLVRDEAGTARPFSDVLLTFTLNLESD